MSNTAAAPTPITTPGVYYDVVPRVLRNVNSYPFNGTFTSTVTVATANAIPQITQGNEVMAFNHTANSLSSWLEFEVFTNMLMTSPSPVGNFWLALFADYSPDALVVCPGTFNGFITQHPYFKHYMMPVSLNPIRYSLRMAPSANAIVVNWFAYGGRTQSRVTVKEWSGLSLNNTAP
jgi:hypothetical protein